MLYHGTSQASADLIKKHGFKMHTGFLGNGVYLAGSNYPPHAWEMKKKTAVNYAMEKEKGTVVATCVPENIIKHFRDFYH
jgi:hypothetical protein